MIPKPVITVKHKPKEKPVEENKMKVESGTIQIIEPSSKDIFSSTLKIDDNGEKDLNEEHFMCKICNLKFGTGQALGGHMSRKHPGKSDEYNHKRGIRLKRAKERVRLYLSKKRFYSEIHVDYDKERKTREGKILLKTKMNRTLLKKIKMEISDMKVEEFINNHPNYLSEFDMDDDKNSLSLNNEDFEERQADPSLPILQVDEKLLIN